MLEDVIKTIKAHLYERATSPLFGAFAISWCIWNYRFLLIIFSSLPVDHKFYFINAFVFNDISSYVLRGFIGPLTTTGLIIFVYPYPAKLVFSFWKRRQLELNKLRQEIEEETLLSLADSRKIRKEIADFQVETDKTIQKKEEEIERLKSVMLSLQNEIDNYQQIKSQNQYSKDNLPEESLQILSLIGKNGGSVFVSNIDLKGFSPVEIEHYLDKLMPTYIYRDGSQVRLSPAGREFIVRNKMI